MNGDRIRPCKAPGALRVSVAMRRFFSAVLSVAMTCGCGSVATQNRQPTAFDIPPPPPEQSLVPTDAAALTDAEIARILEANLVIASRPRVALVHLQHRSVHWATVSQEEVVNSVSEGVVSRLRNSRRVSDASYLPPFLVSRSPSVAQLREAAARYQADLVLLFSTDCSLHESFNAFSPNEARAYCHADSALLDVRTGLVPFASRTAETVTVREAGSEFSIAETLRRAQLAGINAAMRTNAEAVVRFIDSASAGTPTVTTQ